MGFECHLLQLQSRLTQSNSYSSHSSLPQYLRSFHTISSRSDQSSSSKRFIRRAQTDTYGKSQCSHRGEKVYVARSAHKLIQLDQTLKLFPKHHGRTNVLDLGASPGGWTEVALERLGEIRTKIDDQHRLIACDLLPLSNSILVDIPSNSKLVFIQGDFLSHEVHSRILEALQPNPNSKPIPTIVLSDLLGSISGIPIKDAQNSLDLCLSVTELTRKLLQTQGGHEDDTLVIKHIQSGLTDELRTELKENWKSVKWIKPLASRSESREGYFVARQRK